MTKYLVTCLDTELECYFNTEDEAKRAINAELEEHLSDVEELGIQEFSNEYKERGILLIKTTVILPSFTIKHVPDNDPDYKAWLYEQRELEQDEERQIEREDD